MTDEYRQQLMEIERDHYASNHILFFTSTLPTGRRKSVQHMIRQFTDSIPRTLEPAQQVQLIYAVMTNSLRYDTTENQTRYSYLQPLLQASGVCEGIAELFLLLTQPLGLKTMIVTGTAGPPEDQGLHAWNMVQLPQGQQKRWYHLDATWDLGRSRWNYFLRSDDYMQNHHHDWLPHTLPPAPYDHSRLAPLNHIGISKLTGYLNQLRREIKT